MREQERDRGSYDMYLSQEYAFPHEINASKIAERIFCTVVPFT